MTHEIVYKPLDVVLKEAGEKWEELHKGHSLCDSKAHRAKEYFVFGYLQIAYKKMFNALVTDSTNKEIVNKKLTK